MSGQKKRQPAGDRPKAAATARGKLRLLPASGSESPSGRSTADTDLGDASELPVLAIVAAASPAVRAKKVARLKAAIADGTYNADPQEIAKALLASGFTEES